MTKKRKALPITAKRILVRFFFISHPPFSIHSLGQKDLVRNDRKASCIVHTSETFPNGSVTVQGHQKKYNTNIGHFHTKILPERVCLQLERAAFSEEWFRWGQTAWFRPNQIVCFWLWRAMGRALAKLGRPSRTKGVVE